MCKFLPELVSSIPTSNSLQLKEQNVSGREAQTNCFWPTETLQYFGLY